MFLCYFCHNFCCLSFQMSSFIRSSNSFSNLFWTLQKRDKTPKSGHPKLKRLRQRLQYKKREEDENAHGVEEDLVAHRDKNVRKKVHCRMFALPHYVYFSYPPFIVFFILSHILLCEAVNFFLLII